MKKGYVLVVVLFTFFAALVPAQVPNGGFEDWADGQPANWWTTNAFYVTITQTNDAHSGSSAAKGTVGNFMGEPAPPALVSGQLGYTGFPINQRYATVNGYYKFSPVQNDVFEVSAVLWKGGEVFAAGSIDIPDAAGDYTPFSFPLEYLSGDTPDSAQIIFSIYSDEKEHEGSYFIVDDVTMQGEVSTGIADAGQITSYSLAQNYPNPFNPSTTINYDLPAGGIVTLKVYDALGSEAAMLVNEFKEAGSHKVTFDASGLAAGVYFYRINVNGFSSSKKLMLLK